MNEEKFKKELIHIINCNSMENASNTPDYMLAEYLCACLRAWNETTQMRETWYGRDARPTAAPSTSSLIKDKIDDTIPAATVEPILITRIAYPESNAAPVERAMVKHCATCVYSMNDPCEVPCNACYGLLSYPKWRLCEPLKEEGVK